MDQNLSRVEMHNLALVKHFIFGAYLLHWIKPVNQSGIPLNSDSSSSSFLASLGTWKSGLCLKRAQLLGSCFPFRFKLFLLSPCLQLLMFSLPIILLSLRCVGGINKDVFYEVHRLFKLQSRSSH